MTRSAMFRTSLAICFAVLMSIFLAGVALGRSPIPTGTKRNFHGNNPVTYRHVNSPGSWFNSAVDTALETNFHQSTSNNSKVPSLDHNGSGTGRVNYKTASSSPCGTGNTAWLQCAVNSNADENWTIYVLNLSTSGPSGWTWWDETSGCQGHSSTCWYVKRAIIHEAGHAMLAFPDMCLGSEPCRDELDTVMNSKDPVVGTRGSTHFTYRRCEDGRRSA